MAQTHHIHRGNRLRLLTLALLLPVLLSAQTRSRISGSVTDQNGEALIGANIIVQDSDLGAASDSDGRFIIINVPIGTWDVKCMMMGYETQVISEVMVSADRVAKVNFRLSPAVLQSDAVEVVAYRSVMDREVSNTQLVVSDVQIQEATGIRDINAFLTKLPGVGEDNGYLTIRGGSADQTGLMVNGMAYANPATGNAESTLPLSAIEQVSLQSGGYNAEYGNFRSGLINVTTKSGNSERFEGTLTVTRNQPQLGRFGDSFYQFDNAALRPFLDADVAFVGTETAWADDPYTRQQYPSFMGWNLAAMAYNAGKADSLHATPLDYYLLGAWMHMAIPDYEGLAELGYSVSDEQRALFESHHMKEENSNWNVDAGFGGPLKFLGSGKATFYISHNSRENYYIQPVTLPSERTATTFLTLRSKPARSLTLTLNALHKQQNGISPIRPAWGDFPDAGREGGFMPVNNIKYIAANPEYWYDPPFFPTLQQRTLMGGFTLNHILSDRTYWELTLSAMDIQDASDVGDNRDSTVITRFGPFPVTEMPYGKLMEGVNVVDGYEYPSYDALPGIPRRYRRKEGDLYTDVNVRHYRLKADIVSQKGLHHYLKGGLEHNYIDIKHHLWQKWNENYYNAYEFNYHRTPTQTGLYIQDQMSFDEIIANLGLRLDFYNGGGGKWPTGDLFADEAFLPQFIEEDTVLFSYLESGRSYIWDYWLAYDSAHPGFMQPIKNYLTLSPRIGVSFPVSENAKFYFNYGHFRSNPPYYTMYLYRYRYTKNGLYDLSNPNLEPPRTISYELGFMINVLNDYLLKVAAYSKDVTGQHGELNVLSSTGLDYDMWVNNEYEDIQGLELNVSKNDGRWLSGWMNFNYMLQKDGLVGREELTEESTGDDREGLYEGQEDRTLPRPEFNMSLTFKTPRDFGPELLKSRPAAGWNLTFFYEWEMGRYFTWNPLDIDHVSNNMQWPDYRMLDLKLSRDVRLFGMKAGFYVDVRNVLNIKVQELYRGYAFTRESGDLDEWGDFRNYFASLKLPLYESEDYDALREQNPGLYLPGNDAPGDLRSDDKPYINDPNLDFWIYKEPRDIWIGFNFSF